MENEIAQQPWVNDFGLKWIHTHQTSLKLASGGEFIFVAQMSFGKTHKKTLKVAGGEASTEQLQAMLKKWFFHWFFFLFETLQMLKRLS